MRTAPTRTSDIIPAALASAGAAGLLAAALLAGISPWQAAMTLLGAAAYHVMTLLDDRAPHAPYDLIQTGESAAAAFTLIAVALFVTGEPAVMAGAVMAVMLAYQLFMRFVIAPDAREAAPLGAAVLAITALIVARIAWERGPDLLGPASQALAGLVPSLPAGPLAPALAAPAVAGIGALALLLGPELCSYAEGPEFCCLPRRQYALMTAGLVLARGLLAAIALLFSGWLCCVGHGVRLTYRGPLPGVFGPAALAAFALAMLLVAHAAGALAAAACAFAVSWALFFIHIITRVVQHDRRETL